MFDGLGKLSSKSFGVEGELGYRLPVGSSILDIGGGLAWVNTKHEDFSLASIDYDFDKSKSLRGNVGARFESQVGVFVDARVFHEFRDDNDLTLSSGAEIDTIESDGRGTWFRGELGYGKPSALVNEPKPTMTIPNKTMIGIVNRKMMTGKKGMIHSIARWAAD